MGGNTRPVIYLLDAAVAVTGAFNCARNISRALNGVADVVVVLPRQSTIPTHYLEDFSAVHYLPIANLRRSFWAVLRYLPLLFTSAWQLKKLMKKDGAEQLILNDFYLMHGSVLRLFGFRGAISAWVRIDPRSFGRILSGIWLLILSLSTDRVLAVSHFIQTCLPADFRSELLYDGVATSTASQATHMGRRRLVYVGNYIEGKGQDAAIEVFAGLAAQYPELVLEFYGGDMGLEKNRSWKNQLVARTGELRLSERIQFGDFVTDTRAVLEGAFAALNFSTSESFSMTVLEASAAGVPVVATRSGGPAEIIEDGVTGFLVQVGDIAAIRVAISQLLDNPSLATDMGNAGRSLVEDKFSFAKFRSRLLCVFDLSGE